MKISLKEARKRVSSGKLVVDAHEQYEPRWRRNIHGRERNPSIRTFVSLRRGDCSDEDDFKRCDATAALLAHCWNRFDEVVAALEKLNRYMLKGERLPELPDATTLLKRVKTVEMP